MPDDLADRPQALYRFWDASGVLLYVGISVNPTGRFDQHRGDKSWWHEIASITIQAYPDRPTVEAAEKAAIIAETPLYNIVHNVARTRRAPGTLKRGTEVVVEYDDPELARRRPGGGWDHVHTLVQGELLYDERVIDDKPKSRGGQPIAVYVPCVGNVSLERDNVWWIVPVGHEHHEESVMWARSQGCEWYEVAHDLVG